MSGRFVNRADSSDSVQAIQFTGNFDAIEEFAGGDAQYAQGELIVAYTGGAVRAHERDWLTKRDGRIVVYSDAMFNEMYVAVRPAPNGDQK